MALSVVQHTSANASSGLTLGKAFTSNVVAGNLLVVVGNTTSASTTMNTPTDTLLTVYNQAVLESPGSNGQVAIWYGKALSSGANTVTLGITVSHHIYLAIYEIHSTLGIFAANTAPLDKTLTGNQTTTTAASVGPTATTTVANEYVIAAFCQNNAASTWTVGAGYGDTETQNAVAGSSLFVEDKIVSATAAMTATATATITDLIQSVIATFKEPIGSQSFEDDSYKVYFPRTIEQIVTVF
jgi:hypothetical protein